MEERRFDEDMFNGLKTWEPLWKNQSEKQLNKDEFYALSDLAKTVGLKIKDFDTVMNYYGQKVLRLRFLASPDKAPEKEYKYKFYGPVGVFRGKVFILSGKDDLVVKEESHNELTATVRASSLVERIKKDLRTLAR